MARRAGTILAGLALAACAPGAPQEVTLAELALAAADYDGETVETEGTVREFTPEDDDALEHHFAVEDEEQNRVQVIPHHLVETRVDEYVRVVGTFTFDEEVGRLIEIEEIEPADRPADL
jgi:hypothetical protein